MLLRQLYTFGSLKNAEHGVQFSIKNRLSDAEFTELQDIRINGSAVPLDAISIDLGDGEELPLDRVSPSHPLAFPLRQTLIVRAGIAALPLGKHKIEIAFKSKPFGALKFEVEDAIAEVDERRIHIPRDTADDYAETIIGQRQHFAERFSGVKLEHTTKYSFDPHRAGHNCENFTGVAQIPLGLAGPITIHGEHAQGDFLIPLATTEGTLVASYNRGIKVINLCGGVMCTVVNDAMQRAPVFEFADARAAREFAAWVHANFGPIREQAEATSSVARLHDIDPYLASKFVYLRFNYTTGDAAGQNMVGRATFAACGWILDHYRGVEHFYLESNFATDKKASQVNIMRTRGKRVTAEVTIPRDVLRERMRVEPETLVHHYNVANVGAILSGANNNGLHSANGITAMFIATGQDVANVAESSAAFVHAELRPNGDYYYSITIPSLIVATYGGGTGLPTQRECLEMLDCYGKGKASKFAEICAAVVLAGDTSLSSAILADEWVSSHDAMGRNRP